MPPGPSPTTERYSENEMIPLSALQHLLYCPRQCALIHLEQQWAENCFTTEGRVMHRQAHGGPDESRPGIRITRGLPVGSLTLGVSGQCDVVEFHDSGGVLPVEYKRGKPKSHRADEVQLCAQAICLEEMLDCVVPFGALFYGKRKRRIPVELDQELRDLTFETATSIHSMVESKETPPAIYDKGLCDNCSLLLVCQPKVFRFRRGASAWFQRHLLAP